MLYRENGQFKSSYRADQQIFPITQDRVGIWLLLAFAFVGVPLLANEYLFRAILVPFLILSLAALGVNILVGYCGQISLGSGAFMAVGAYAAYNCMVRIESIIAIIGGSNVRICAVSTSRRSRLGSSMLMSSVLVSIPSIVSNTERIAQHTGMSKQCGSQ